MTKYNLAIDSNVFTYLVEAVDPDYNPENDNSDLREERISILRIALYYSGLVVLPTVKKEYKKIKNTIKRENHLQIFSVILTTYNFEYKRDLMLLMAEELRKYHMGNYDRLIYSEAYYSEIDYLLSCDGDFISHLSNKKNVVIIKPSEMWVNILKIPKLSESLIVPHSSNPLSKKNWWKW